MQKEEPKAFSKSYPDYVDELYTECSIYNYRGQKADYTAFWDTGASNSLITKKVVDDLKLAVTEFAELYHAGGSNISNCYVNNEGHTELAFSIPSTLKVNETFKNLK